MTPHLGRRHQDHPGAPHRRREDMLTDLLEHGSENFRRYRRWALVAFVVLTLANAFALYWTWSISRENCAKLHTLVVVGSDIIGSGRADIESYYREGTITRGQRDRALAGIADRLAQWRSADCPAKRE